MTTDVTVIEKRGAEAVELAKEISITNDASYQTAVNFVTEMLKPRLREIDKTFDPIIANWWKGHKESKAEKKRHEQGIKEAEQICRGYGKQAGKE